MSHSRRRFLKTTASGTLLGSLVATGCLPGSATGAGPTSSHYAALDAALARPVLRRTWFKEPLLIESIDLLHHEGSFLCRVRTREGAEGLCVSNNYQMQYLYPIFLKRIAPFFVGKDARDWEALQEEVYVYKSNYKLQNLALWVPLATLEFAILDLLGQVAGQPMGALLGEIHHPQIAVYQANNFRGKSAEESIARIEQQVQESQAQALKFKVGGRMSHNRDDPPGRSEQLIPLVRERFPELTIYADANGSYDTTEAIRIGQLMQAHEFDFYEEPVPFDWYQETLAVNQALRIPIAGGEQEPSLRNFRWLIANDALDIVQPDIFYFGGMVRSMRVARMAEAVGKPCIPHISGSGLGYLYMMHFVSALPNAGPYHEFKGFAPDIPMHCPTADLQVKGGTIQVPTGPGLGVELDPAFVARHQPIADLNG